MPKQVICFSEAGWRGMRRFSLLLNRLGISNLVFISARPPREVREIIEDKSHIFNFFFPRKFFRILSYLILARRLLVGKVAGIVVEKRRTLKTLQFTRDIWKTPIFFLEEIDGGFRLFKDGMEVKNPDTILESLLS